MKRLYKGSDRSPLLNDIDAVSWMRLGWTEMPEQEPVKAAPAPEPITKPPDVTPPALRLINGVSLPSEMEIIPTIGRSAATHILENRPEGGYVSLDQVWELNPVILGGRFKTDPELIAVWGDG